MKLFCIAPILGLEFENTPQSQNNDEIKIVIDYDITLTGNIPKATEQIPDQELFERKNGSLAINNIRSSKVVAYVLLDTDAVLSLKGRDDLSTLDVATYFGFCVMNAIDLLWVIEDNSVNIPIVYCQNLDNHEKVSSTIIFRHVQKADGQESVLLFKRDYIPCFIGAAQTFVALRSPNKGSDKFNRVERFWSLSLGARHSKDTLLKISLYVAALECLFTTDSAEVSHKVRERVAWYLGNDELARKQIYDDVKTAYDIRSAYMHGKNITVN